MFKNLLHKITHAPSAEDKRFWWSVGVLVVFAAIGAIWMLFASLK